MEDKINKILDSYWGDYYDRHPENVITRELRLKLYSMIKEGYELGVEDKKEEIKEKIIATIKKV